MFLTKENLLCSPSVAFQNMSKRFTILIPPMTFLKA